MRTVSLQRLAAACRDAPRQPVYLLGSTRTLVRESGPRLTISRADIERVIPLVRIARIVCGDAVDWQGAALRSCLELRIPIVWVARSGSVLGAAAGHIDEAVPLHQGLEIYTEASDWRSIYGNWLRRRRMSVLVRWCRDTANLESTLDPREVDERKRSFVHRAELPRGLPEFTRAWCYAAVRERLARLQIASRYIGHGGETLDLADDLTALLWSAFAFDCGSIPRTARDLLVTTTLCENWLRLHTARVDDHIADLARHVRRANESWH